MRTYEDSKKELHSLGDGIEFDIFIKDDWVLLTKEQVEDLENKENETIFKNKKDNVISEINNNVTVAITSGFVSSALGEDYNYKSTLIDQNNLIQNLLSGVSCKVKVSKDNEKYVEIEHSVKQLKQVNNDFIKHRDNKISKGVTLKSMINGVADIEGLKDLDLVV